MCHLLISLNNDEKSGLFFAELIILNFANLNNNFCIKKGDCDFQQSSWILFLHLTFAFNFLHIRMFLTFI